MAVKLLVSPLVTVDVAGLTVIAVNAGGVTVKVAPLEVMPLADAVIVVLP